MSGNWRSCPGPRRIAARPRPNASPSSATSCRRPPGPHLRRRSACRPGWQAQAPTASRPRPRPTQNDVAGRNRLSVLVGRGVLQHNSRKAAIRAIRAFTASPRRGSSNPYERISSGDSTRGSGARSSDDAQLSRFRKYNSCSRGTRSTRDRRLTYLVAGRTCRIRWRPCATAATGARASETAKPTSAIVLSIEFLRQIW